MSLSSSDERGYYERIYKVVQQVPPGKVTTYGDVAAIVAEGCDARIVGHAMGALGPRSVEVPWQRVIGRTGRITTSGLHQRDKLEAEGIGFDERGYALMERFRWEGPSAEWAQANGCKTLSSEAAAEEEAPDSQLRLF
ncbi:MGMT family protein [Stigmatella erecta]|uniref:Methylated-DNA-protein-cysteine methyltransferase related protein n=1 Tax=Stigmatella erecta TaxID=83460 RepID=A0A1I0L2Q5_9BACT|nr:MGMT family protein [Stigmatella erecta]SEU33737.1 methylated-DNA-protein-cysteine methyltransferase related protein [Stigmatella erecta]